MKVARYTRRKNPSESKNRVNIGCILIPSILSNFTNTQIYETGKEKRIKRGCNTAKYIHSRAQGKSKALLSNGA
jgi:hypothetical protein